MPELNEKLMGRVRHIHFVGIGGAGMSGIAEVLNNLGYEVSGSDLHETRVTHHLQSLGVKVIAGHDAAHVNGSDVVVVSTAIADENPELMAAHEQRIPVVPRAEMLAELMRFRMGIAVAGTHGKTTTTSLIASLLAEGGLDPTYVIGGLLNSTGSHAKLGSGQYLVAEADESDASFLHLQPVMAVLTNIDAEHLETYAGDFQCLKNNFSEFLHRLPFYGLVVLCVDDAGNRDILAGIVKPFITYGIDKEADFVAQDIRYEQSQTFFTVTRAGQQDILHIQLNLPGMHNVRNALAAIAVATELGVPRQAIENALLNFQGIARRSDVLGEVRIGDCTLLLIDDYAHHPTEIEAILSAVDNGWPGRHVVVVFQPHRYTRTRDLFENFCQVLSDVDALLLLEVYPAGEPDITGADGRSLCRGIRMRGKVEPVFVDKRQDLQAMLPGIVRDDGILLILGAGDIGSLGAELFAQYGQQVH
ncbi:MAG: UDP-N-acetylmuramate--L-alanine ligase [Gammaproteobacteria bacterium]|nr:UDP-N-acetylmuramate--L-alanine ligase [Gammaproteobacteria bacterium]